MGLNRILAVAASEVRLLNQSGALWKLTGLHGALLVATLLLTWPTAERLAAATPPFTLKWLLLVEIAALGYITLVLASDSLAWGEVERLRPVHWVAYGASPAWAALGGRIFALWYVLAQLGLTSLPVFVLAHGASPVPVTALGAWVAVALTTLTLLGVIGVGIGARFAERTNRRIAVDTFSLASALLLFAVSSKGNLPTDGLFFYLNPLKVAMYVVDPPFHSLEGAFFLGISWPWWLALYASVGLGLVGMVTFQLNRASSQQLLRFEKQWLSSYPQGAPAGMAKKGGEVKDAKGGAPPR